MFMSMVCVPAMLMWVACVDPKGYGTAYDLESERRR